MQLALLLALSAFIVAASLGCVVGVKRLTYWMRLDRWFLGEIVVTFAWVLPEYLIAMQALIVPGRVANHGGDPFISVGAIMGSAAANMLIIGLLNLIRPGRAGLEAVGAGRPLASAALVLLVSCLTIVGLGIGRGNGMSLAQLLAGLFVFAVFLAGLRLVFLQNPKNHPQEFSDELGRPARGSLIGSLALAGVSIIALIYAAPYFVEFAIPWYRSGEDLSHHARALLLGSLTLDLGLLLALPDFLLTAFGLEEKDGDAPTPRLFLSSAALIAFTALAGMDYETLWNGFASSLYGSFLLTVFVVALTVIMLLAIPTRLTTRTRGVVVTLVAFAGLLFSALMVGH